jgi:hypothetical protein
MNTIETMMSPGVRMLSPDFLPWLLIEPRARPRVLRGVRKSRTLSFGQRWSACYRIWAPGASARANSFPCFADMSRGLLLTVLLLAFVAAVAARCVGRAALFRILSKLAIFFFFQELSLIHLFFLVLIICHAHLQIVCGCRGSVIEEIETEKKMTYGRRSQLRMREHVRAANNRISNHELVRHGIRSSHCTCTGSRSISPCHLSLALHSWKHTRTFHTRIRTFAPARALQDMAELALVDTASITNLLEGAGAPIIPTGKVSLHGGNVFTDKAKVRKWPTLVFWGASVSFHPKIFSFWSSSCIDARFSFPRQFPATVFFILVSWFAFYFALVCMTHTGVRHEVSRRPLASSAAQALAASPSHLCASQQVHSQLDAVQ